ncbi:MAG: hypothetical protein BMS9Abin05_1370 [Rhodothermia bacterium]|nr:MAG: hypothetical protein BMS9Abin05_1370 [Rhodothermia bacterium]
MPKYLSTMVYTLCSKWDPILFYRDGNNATEGLRILLTVTLIPVALLDFRF